MSVLLARELGLHVHVYIYIFYKYLKTVLSVLYRRRTVGLRTSLRGQFWTNANLNELNEWDDLVINSGSQGM